MKKSEIVKTLPYISVEEFNEKVEEQSEKLPTLKYLLRHKQFKSWEDLPVNLINDLFIKIGFKPKIYKY